MSDSGKLSVAWLYDDSLDTNDGVAQYVKTLGAWMSSQGHRVSYLVGDSKLRSWHGAPVYSLSKNLKVRWGGNQMSIPLKPRLKDVKAVLSEQKFDVVHVTAPYSPLMAKQVINRLPEDVALIGTWHIYPANRTTIRASKLLKPAYGRSLKRFDDFISVSSAAKEYAQSVFGVDSVVIPNAVKQPLTKSKNPRAGRIVFLGRLVERKGVEYLIRAFAKLAANMPEVELIIAGDGPLRSKLESVVKENGIENAVNFLGYVDEAEKFDLLASAQIACFPSIYGESFGIVLIEAMAAGAKIVVGGDNPGYRSVLGAKPDLLVEPRQTDEFAKRLEKLMHDDNLTAELNHWQQQQINKYDVDMVGPQIIELYRRIIAKRQDSGHN